MKRILALCCALVLALGMLGCATAEEAAAPKYVFMFIGNGMGSPQVSATQYFLGTLSVAPARFAGATLLFGTVKTWLDAGLHKIFYICGKWML